MKVECPHCHTDNEIQYAQNITCQKCEKSFEGFQFSKRKIVSVGTAILFGFAGYKANGVLTEERYPLEVEFAIIDTCLNSARLPVSISRYQTKRDRCLCALEKTQEKIDYKGFKESKSEFSATLVANAKSC